MYPIKIKSNRNLLIYSLLPVNNIWLSNLLRHLKKIKKLLYLWKTPYAWTHKAL